MFNPIRGALLAGPQVNIALCHHRKHRIINGQAIAAKKADENVTDPAARRRPEIAGTADILVFS